MKLKIWFSLFLVLLLAVGCSANEEKKANESKKEETMAKKEQTNELQQNKELTKEINEEKGVIAGQAYVKNGIAYGAIVLDKKVSDADAKKLAEKYARELKKEYKDMKVNVQAVRDGKNVAGVILD
jgi:PBP1b-binding outer membrane lipoprotein LpoB